VGGNGKPHYPEVKSLLAGIFFAYRLKDFFTREKSEKKQPEEKRKEGGF